MSAEAIRCAVHGFGTRARPDDFCDLAESGFARCQGTCGMAAIVSVSVSRGLPQSTGQVIPGRFAAEAQEFEQSRKDKP